MMDAIDIIARCRLIGVELRLDGDVILVRGPVPLPDELREAIREHKSLVARVLEACRGSCLNRFTSHDRHEYPWECDPASCFCYTAFGAHKLCGNVPCRWVWPGGQGSNA